MNSATRDYIRDHAQDGAAAIAAGLAADQRFQRRIYADDLNGLFGAQPLIPLKMKDAVQNFPRTEQTMLMLAGIDRLLETARLGGQAGWLGTDIAEYAAQVRMFAPAVVQAKVLKQPEVDALLALGGGFLYDRELTEGHVQEVLDALAAETQAAEAAAQRAAAITAFRVRVDGVCNELRGLVDHAERGSDSIPELEGVLETVTEAWAS